MNDDSLFVAVGTGTDDHVRAAIVGGADVNARGPLGQTPVYRAAVRGNVAILSVLLDSGGDPDGADDFGNTPLMQAAARGFDACVRLLLERGAQPNARNKWSVDAVAWSRWATNGDVCRDEILARTG